MRLKPKTVRRLLLLSLAVAILAGAGTALWVVRGYRIEARLETRRAAGLKAEAAGDHATAISQLAAYLRQRPGDADVLLAYARARRQIEERDGRHLTAAATAYQRYLGLRDNDQQARRELLQCLAEAGMWVEVCDVARHLRPADPAKIGPADLDVLQYEISARRARRDFGDESLALARRAVQLDPDDFGLRIQLVSLLNLGQRAQEAADFVAQTAGGFKNDPRVYLLQLITGTAKQMTPAESTAELASIAGLDPDTGARKGPALDKSETVLAMLVNGFGSLGRSDLVLSTLEPRAAAGQLNYVRAFARRALYSASYERLVSLQREQASKPAWQAVDVLALVGLALDAMDRRPEADAMFDRLASAEPDYLAASWGLARRPLLDDQAEAPLDAVKDLKAAIDQNPLEPIFRARLAEMLLQLGRAEEARTELAAAEKSPLSDGWARLGVLRARSFLVEDRLAEARKACVETLKHFAGDRLANAMLLAIQCEMLDRGYLDTDQAKGVANQLGPQLDAMAGSNAPRLPPDLQATLVSEIALAADRGGDTELARRALKFAADADLAFPAQTLSRLVEISRRRGFGFEAPLLAKAEHNGPTPDSVLVRAIDLNARAHADQAIDLVRKAVAQKGADADTTWRVLVPSFLDIIGSADAAKEWMAVLDRYPDDLRAHLLAIQSPSLSRDPDLVARVADRIESLSGTRGSKAPIAVRVARARALASGSNAAGNHDQLIGVLRGIVADAPDLVEPRLLLADALTPPAGAGDGAATYSEAIEQLRAASAFAPNPIPIRLRIADLLRRAGNSEAASAELTGIAADPRTDLNSKWSVVESLAALGRFDDAAAMARDIVPVAGKTAAPERAIALAGILTLAGKPDDARRVYMDLAARGDVISPDAASAIASGLAAIGSADDARAMLDRLGADPSRRRAMELAKVRLALAGGAPDEARSILADLTTSDPKDAEAWRLLVQSYADAGNVDEARRELAKARQELPDNPELGILALEIEFRAGHGDATSLRTLADLLDKAPSTRERAAAVREYAALLAQGDPPDPEALRKLAAKHEDEPTIQSVIISDLLRATPPALAAAAEVSLRAARRFPAQWQTSADVVRVHRLMGKWNVVLDAAERWGRLTNSREADLAVAEAHLQLNQTKLARAAIEPLVSSALQHPEAALDVLDLWGRILVAARQTDEARRALEPAMRASPDVLTGVWLHLAGEVVDTGSAAAWLDAAQAPAASHGTSAEAALANAWFSLALRDPGHRSDYLGRSRAILERVAAATPDPRVNLLLGQVAGEMKDYQRARAAFNAASEDARTRPEALRGIAQVALEDSPTPDEAIRSARLAVEASHSKDAGSWRILGDALLAGAESSQDAAGATALAGQAADAFDAAVRLVGENPALLGRLASACEKAGRPDAAIGAFERILALPPERLSLHDRAATQNNLAVALSTHRTDKASLERARSLATSAFADLPDGAILDTLGSIEAALGNRATAIDAYRRSLVQRPSVPATIAKLAELLSSGTQAEKDESKQLVLQAEKASTGAGSDADAAETKERLRRVRAALGMP